MAQDFDKDDLAVILTDDDRLCDVCDEAFAEADSDKKGIIYSKEITQVMEIVAKKIKHSNSTTWYYQ